MDSSPLYRLQTTSYGGRGLFTTHSIPKATLPHTCQSPYASVIYRTFRKEVCGQCFAYAFDASRNTWNVKSDAGNGVWFCSETCRTVWLEEQNVGGLLGLMNAAVDKLAKSMKKSKEGDSSSPRNKHCKHDDTNIEITLETLDMAWKNAERHNTYSHAHGKPTSGSPSPQLDDMELDTVRFAISAIVNRYIEDTASPPVTPGASRWGAFLQLQDNELMHVRTRPHILASHLRVYMFLRRALLPVLQAYVATSEMVRAILGRDQGNVFGMWDMSTEGESEMLGWSMYVSGSYFNHSEC